jgi:hypothetical protein
MPSHLHTRSPLLRFLPSPNLSDGLQRVADPSQPPKFAPLGSSSPEPRGTPHLDNSLFPSIGQMWGDANAEIWQNHGRHERVRLSLLI